MTTAGARDSAWTPEAVRRQIRRLTGLAFPDSRLETLSRSLDRGVRRSLSPDVGTYLSRVEREPALLDDLVAEITVGETYFFRDPEQFRVIRDRILPALLRVGSGRPLRIWSAGCATGEEAYTLAMLLEEAGAPLPARIVGTDLSRIALARAREGRYTRWALRGLTADQVSRYFGRNGGEFVLPPELRRAVDFRYLNLVADAYPSLASGISGMDLVLCRNVLIYFDADTAALVTGRLMRALAPGGWLLLGASDPLPAEAGTCEVVITGAGLAYHRPTQAAFALPEVASPATPRPWGTPPPSPPDAGLAPASTPPGVGCVESPSSVAAAEPPAFSTHRHPVPGPIEAPLPGPDQASAAARVRALANAGDLVAAGRACAAALDRDRTSAELTYLHGLLLGEAGRGAEAAAALRAAIYLDRTLVVAHLALGGQLLRLGDKGGAERALKNAGRLLATQPEDAQIPASDGNLAGRLAAVARAHLALVARGSP